MATYELGSNKLIATGTDITTPDLIQAMLDLDYGIGSSYDADHKAAVINVPIQIGKTRNDPTENVWTCHGETIFFEGTYIIIYGQVLMGRQDTNGNSYDGGALMFSHASSPIAGIWVWNDGTLNAYNSVLHSNRIIRIGRDSTFAAVDSLVHFTSEVATGNASSSYGTNQVLDFRRTTFTGDAVYGLQLTSWNTVDEAPIYRTDGIRIRRCTYAVQSDSKHRITSVLWDGEFDGCDYHVTFDHAHDADLTFGNPDFDRVRFSPDATHAPDASDVVRVVYAYDITALDASRDAVPDAVVRIVDGADVVRADNLVTDTDGKVSGLPTFGTRTALLAFAYQGPDETDHRDTFRAVVHYGYDLRTETLTVDQNIDDRVVLNVDEYITNPDRSAVEAYTTLDTPQKLYDYAKAYLVANYNGETALLLRRHENTIFSDRSIKVDLAASSAFSVGDDGAITIKASTFVGNFVVPTTETVSAVNGATIEGDIADSNGDSHFAFVGIDRWEVYADEARTVELGRGVTPTFPFVYTSGADYFLRLKLAGETFEKTLRPAAKGRTEVSITDASLLTSLFARAASKADVAQSVADVWATEMANGASAEANMLSAKSQAELAASLSAASL